MSNQFGDRFPVQRFTPVRFFNSYTFVHPETILAFICAPKKTELLMGSRKIDGQGRADIAMISVRSIS
jgi:hypothetical protein